MKPPMMINVALGMVAQKMTGGVQPKRHDDHAHQIAPGEPKLCVVSDPVPVVDDAGELLQPGTQITMGGHR